MTRCEEAGYVQRRAHDGDRRRVAVHLTKSGERLLAHLAALHRSELRSLGDVFPIAAINEEGGR